MKKIVIVISMIAMCLILLVWGFSKKNDAIEFGKLVEDINNERK